MKVIGLYAGVGAGKSTVARIFAECGALCLDADAMVHSAYRDPEVRAAVTRHFGANAFTAAGTVDRQFLADAIFADDAARSTLETILHPRVRAMILAAIDDAQESGVPAVVLDVPLLADSPLQALVTDGVYIDAPLDVREARCQQSRGWQVGEVARRDARQPALARKRELCRFVVTNDATTSTDDLRQQISTIWNQLIGAGTASA